MADDQQQQPKSLPDLAAWLEYQHQQAQEAIASQTALGLAILWPILKFDDLDSTTTTWLHAVTLQIEKQFKASEDAAFVMVQGVKWASEPVTEPLKQIVTTFPTKAAQQSMMITGPIAVKASMPAPQDDAMARADLGSTGAGVRTALNGGRGEVQSLVTADAVQRRRQSKVIGYKRVTDDDPCYFCAMLASRGATYLTSSTFDESNSKIRTIRGESRAYVGDGIAKVHDHCKCSLVPVYSKADKYDDRAKYFLAQWNKATKNLSGDDAMNAFRKVYVPPPPYESPAVDLDAVRANREALISTGFAAGSPQVRWYDAQISKLTA